MWGGKIRKKFMAELVPTDLQYYKMSLHDLRFDNF